MVRDVNSCWGAYLAWQCTCQQSGAGMQDSVKTAFSNSALQMHKCGMF